MKYYHTIISGVNIITVREVESFQVACGNIFRTELKRVFPAANGIFLIGYRDQNNQYHFGSPSKIVANVLIEDGNWEDYTWGE